MIGGWIVWMSVSWLILYHNFAKLLPFRKTGWNVQISVLFLTSWMETTIISIKALVKKSKGLSLIISFGFLQLIGNLPYNCSVIAHYLKNRFQQSFLLWWKYHISALSNTAATNIHDCWALERWLVQLKNWILNCIILIKLTFKWLASTIRDSTEMKWL